MVGDAALELKLDGSQAHQYYTPQPADTGDVLRVGNVETELDGMTGERWNPWHIVPAPSAAEPLTARRGARELAFVLAVTISYILTRGLIVGRTADAIQHADDILAIERALHLAPESAFQALALHQPWLMAAANALYLAGHLPVLLTVAVWLYLRHPWAYRWYRNAFIVSAVLGLTIYVALPVAPPRFLPGFVDTLKASGVNLDGSAIGLFYNPYAAMPSLHVGWSLIAGVAVFACARRWWLRAAGLSLPVFMTLAVLMTGNHYLLDTVAGTAIALIALSLSRWWSSRRSAGTDSECARAISTEVDGEAMSRTHADDTEGVAATLARERSAQSEESTYAIR